MAQHQHINVDCNTHVHHYALSMKGGDVDEAHLNYSDALPIQDSTCCETHENMCLNRGEVLFSTEPIIGGVNLSGDEPLPEIESDATEWREDGTGPPSPSHLHGLCYNLHMENPPDSLWDPASSPSAIAGDFPETYLDAANAFVRGTEPLEKWQIDRDSAMFLAASLALENLGDVLIEPSKLDDGHPSFGDLKVMEPIVHCDPELELRRLWHKNMPTMYGIRMDTFKLSVEDDESIQWPSTALRLPAQIDGTIANEKYEVEYRVREYLHNIVEPATPEALHTFIESEQVSPKPLTPPLLSLSPTFSSPKIPSSLQEMPLTSTPDDLVAIEAAEASFTIGTMDNNEVVNQSDPLSWEEGNKGGIDDDRDVFYYDFTDAWSAVSASIQFRGPGSLKVEAPLLPLDLDRMPAEPKTVAALPSDIPPLLPDSSSNISIMDSTTAQEDLGALVESCLMNAAEPAVLEAAAEKLLEFDTTMRVPVPQLQKTPIHPPWNAYDPSDGGSTINAQRIILSMARRDLKKNETSWSGISKLERLLSWSPFLAQLGEIELDEHLDEDSEKFFAGMASDEDFSILWLLSRPKELHLFDPSSSDDEELESDVWKDDEILGEVGQHDNNTDNRPLIPSLPKLCPQSLPQRSSSFNTQVIYDSDRPSRLTLRSLLQKRKRELDDASQHPARTRHLEDNLSETLEIVKKPGLTSSNSKLSRASDISKQGSIENFMHLQGGLPKNFQTLGYEDQSVQCIAPKACMIVPPSTKETSKIHREKMPSPKLVMPQREMQIIVSPQMLAHRQTLRRLHALLPALDLIERLSPANQSKSDGTYNTAEWREADISVSPILGILTTTLQKLKQKALPGQKSYFGVWEHAAAVSLQYEKVIILVSEGLTATRERESHVQPLDVRDCDALSDLAKFATSLQGIVEVKYVPGGEEELGDWIAALVSQNTITDDSLKLLQEETVWERFLRAGGMNPYAAQAVLAKLKQPTNVVQSSDSDTVDSEGGIFGLAAFVHMAPEERIARFGPLMGGNRVLSRLSRMIDDNWLAA